MWAALAVVFVLALLVRVMGITAIGVGGNDTIYYFTLAEYWKAGDLVYGIGDSARVFRPLYLAFNALWLALLGGSDYALKLGNVLVDSANALLVARLAWLLSGRGAAVLASATAYALLPLAVWASRQELPHTLSTLCVLLAMIQLLRALQCTVTGKSLRALAAAGVLVGAAALTHEELALLALPMVLCILLVRPSRHDRTQVPKRLLAFLCAPLLGALAIVFLQPEAVGGVLGRLMESPAGALARLPEAGGRFLWDVVLGSLSPVGLLYCGVALLYIARRRALATWYRDSGPLGLAALCFMVPVVFVMLNALLFTTIFSRAFLPLVPLLLVGVFTCLHVAGVRWPALSVLVAVLVLSNLASYSAFAVGNREYGRSWAEPAWPTPSNLRRGWGEFLVDARFVPSYATHWRRIYDALQGEVDANNRLLVTPLTAMYGPGRRPLQNQVYFGDDAVYYLDHHEQDLVELLREKQVRWVVFSVGQLRRLPRRLQRYRYAREWSAPEAVDPAGALGMARYSVRAELQLLREQLHGIGAVPVVLFPRGGYEFQNTVVWRIPAAGSGDDRRPD